MMTREKLQEYGDSIVGHEVAKSHLEALDEIEQLRATFGFTYCAYCGKSFDADAPNLTTMIGEHIETCDKHPIHKLEKEIARLRKVEEAFSRIRKEHHEGPGNCSCKICKTLMETALGGKP